MDGISTTVDKHIRLSAEQAERLNRLTRTHRVSEDQIVAKALDILFSLTEILDGQAERQGWSALSEHALRRVWDNDKDAAYDDWQELYGPAAG